MGPGLLAGLGKGIASAGDVFGRTMIQRELMREADAREEQRTQRRFEMEESRAEALKQRMMSEIRQSRERAQEIGTRRDADGLLGLASTLPQGELSGQMSEADLETIRNMPESARRAYQEAGALSTRDRRLQEVDDSLQGAREIGAHSSVLEAFEKQRTATLNEIREENRMRVEDARLEATNRRLDETERSNQERERATQERLALEARRTDAMWARINNPSSGSDSSGVREILNVIPQERLAIKDRMADIARMMREVENLPRNQRAQRVSELEAERQSLIERDNQLQTWINHAAERMGLPMNRTNPPASTGVTDTQRAPAQRGVFNPATGQIEWK